MREYKDEKLLVINNFYGEKTLFELPEEMDLKGYKAEVLISNYEPSNKNINSIKLRPYEAIVYHLEKLNY